MATMEPNGNAWGGARRTGARNALPNATFTVAVDCHHSAPDNKQHIARNAAQNQRAIAETAAD
jgi:hypothetical protein